MKGMRRTPTQRRGEPWPFKYSVVPGRGIVINLPPKERRMAKRPKKEQT